MTGEDAAVGQTMLTPNNPHVLMSRYITLRKTRHFLVTLINLLYLFIIFTLMIILITLITLI